MNKQIINVLRQLKVFRKKRINAKKFFFSCESQRCQNYIEGETYETMDLGDITEFIRDFHWKLVDGKILCAKCANRKRNPLEDELTKQVAYAMFQAQVPLEDIAQKLGVSKLTVINIMRSFPEKKRFYTPGDLAKELGIIKHDKEAPRGDVRDFIAFYQNNKDEIEAGTKFSIDTTKIGRYSYFPPELVARIKKQHKTKRVVKSCPEGYSTIAQATITVGIAKNNKLGNLLGFYKTHEAKILERFSDAPTWEELKSDRCLRNDVVDFVREIYQGRKRSFECPPGSISYKDAGKHLGLDPEPFMNLYKRHYNKIKNNSDCLTPKELRKARCIKTGCFEDLKKIYRPRRKKNPAESLSLAPIFAVIGLACLGLLIIKN